LHEQRQQLQQQYEAANVRLVGPLLSSLLLLVDACVQQGRGQVLLGLQSWLQESFRVVWQAAGKWYALDILAADASSGAGAEQLEDMRQESLELPTGTAAADLGGGDIEGMGPAATTGQTAAAGGDCSSAGALLLSWLPAAVAQAEGCYEAALQQYRQYNSVLVAAGLPSTQLGQPLQEFVLGQMAACYAALWDWKGLATLNSGATASEGHSKGHFKQQQQQQQQQRRCCAQFWVFAGAAGARELQHWQEIAKGSGQQLQQQQQMPMKAGLVKGLLGPGHQGKKHVIEHDQQLVVLDPASCYIHGLSAPGLTVLNALAALQAGDSSKSTSNSRGRQQKQRLIHEEHQGDLLAAAAADIQHQLETASSRPLHLLSVFDGYSAGSCGDNIANAPTARRLQELAVLQVLHSTLRSQQAGALCDSTPAGGGDFVGCLASWLGGLSCRFTEQQVGWGGGSATAEGSTGEVFAAEGVWAGALTPGGQLGTSCFSNISSALPLLQVR
jgi:hypothetical protein